MAKIIRKETRKRGFFGWIFRAIFILFNILMLLWLFSYWGSLSEMNTSSDAERAGAAIGGTIASGMILTIWVLGDIILGLFVLFTRGRKTIIEETVEA